MNKINLETLIGPVLNELWTKYPTSPWTHDEEGALKPIYPTDAFYDQVIVLGLNPSYNPQHRSWASYPTDYDSKGYFKRMGDFMREAARKYRKTFQQTPAGANNQLFVEPELAWSHLDLLYVRATVQRALEANIWSDPDASSFCWEQLQITKNLLIHLRPKMLIVANRFGQRLTGFHYDKTSGANEWMGLHFTAEPDAYGMHQVAGSTTGKELDEGSAVGPVGTPVLFTNSFAGTSIRSKANDEILTDQIAAAYATCGNSHFERWHMNEVREEKPGDDL